MRLYRRRGHAASSLTPFGSAPIGPPGTMVFPRIRPFRARRGPSGPKGHTRARRALRARRGAPRARRGPNSGKHKMVSGCPRIGQPRRLGLTRARCAPDQVRPGRFRRAECRDARAWTGHRPFLRTRCRLIPASGALGWLYRSPFCFPKFGPLGPKGASGRKGAFRAIRARRALQAGGPNFGNRSGAR